MDRNTISFLTWVTVVLLTTVTNSTAENFTITNDTAANSTITNSTAENSTITNSTAANSTITNSTGANSTINNSTAANSTITNDTAANSTITNSTAANSTITNSTAANSTITNSTGANSTINYSTAANSTITNDTAANSTITNSTAANSTITNSTAANSTITNSTAANSTITNSTAANSTITNSSTANFTIANSTAANSTTTNGTAANSTITYSTAANSTITNGSSATTLNDPCNNYTALDQPWRATNATGLWICDVYFNWTGWYRLLYNGMNIQMPESCVNGSRCGTEITLWLNGSHPQIKNGIVTRGVCGVSQSECCYYNSTPIRVKACPGNYYVYEFVKPITCNAAYCADSNRVTQNIAQTNATSAAPSTINANTTNNMTFDPCSVYSVLYNDWRKAAVMSYYNYYSYDDTLVEWSGWYRLYIQGKSAQIPESYWCTSYMFCGGYTALLLGGPNPLPQDGIVTRNIYGTYGYSADSRQCNSYSSNPIQVKACPGNYYVYKLVKPAVSLPMPTYCAVPIDIPSYDPCNNYTYLNQSWRATNDSSAYTSDLNSNWTGWYRLLYNGMNIRMPQSCVDVYRCGTYTTLWLNGSHPQIQDGIVTRGVCGKAYNSDCCYYRSTPIRLKACPGSFYVYEFVRPTIYLAAYCADVSTITSISSPELLFATNVSTITPNTVLTSVSSVAESTNYFVILYVAVGVGVCGIAAFLAVFLWRRKKKNKHVENTDEPVYDDAAAAHVYGNLDADQSSFSDDTYTVPDLQSLSSPDDTYAALDPQSFVSPEYDNQGVSSSE